MSDSRRRVLALDLGQARIGLALSDPLRLTAQPLASLSRRAERSDLDELQRLVEDSDVSHVVVGLPLLLSGAEGSGAAGARRFADLLRQRLPAVEVELWDERLTTVQAERMLAGAGVRGQRRRKVVDAVAAVLILQGYLDAHAIR
jgi:putative Holliday junction resolvase